MSFLDQKQRIATEEDCKARWSGHPKNFRCGLCGHKFIVGEKWRFLFTNDMPGCGGNPFVCGDCDGTNEEVRAKWKAMHDEWKTIENRFWSFLRHFAAATEQEYENERGKAMRRSGYE